MPRTHWFERQPKAASINGMKPLPDRLRAARHLAGYRSVEALYDALGRQEGMSPFQLAAWERGDRVPKPAYVNEIADVCGVDPAWLYGEPGADAPAPDVDAMRKVEELEKRVFQLEKIIAEQEERNRKLARLARALAE